jgi:hypothetical protein
MSGTASITAAMRRRTTNTSLSNTNNTILPETNTNTNTNKQVRIVDVLENHELRMRDIENIMKESLDLNNNNNNNNNNNQTEKVENLEVFNKELTQKINDLVSQMCEIQEQMSVLKSQFTDSANGDNDDTDTENK